MDFAGYPSGSILAAGVSTAASLEGGVWIDLYASTDAAQTWTFVSHIAYGKGPETITNGDQAIWEPFLLMYNGELVCYYSDQRDPAHAQKLVHTTTQDLTTWSDIVPDVANSNYDGRPGMMTVAHIESTDMYIMTYENCGTDDCKVYYKVSSSPLTFDSVEGVRLQTTDGVQTTSGPYVIWTPHPTRTDGSGLIIISGTSTEGIFIGEDSAPTNQWTLMDVNHWSAYSRSLRIISVEGEDKLFFGNGGKFGPKKNNGIACAVVSIPT